MEKRQNWYKNPQLKLRKYNPYPYIINNCNKLMLLDSLDCKNIWRIVENDLWEEDKPKALLG